MFICGKVEEVYPPEINDCSYLLGKAFSSTDVHQMERELLSALSFNFSRPVPLHFLHRYCKAAGADDIKHTMAKYFVETSIIEYKIAHFPSSLIAAAALFLSLMILEPSATLATVWTPILQVIVWDFVVFIQCFYFQYYSSYSTPDLMPLVCKLAQAVLKAKDSKLQAVASKYESKRFMKVGRLPELWGQRMTKLSKKDLEGL